MNASVRSVIEKWYRELNFPQKFDDEFYAALQNVEINEDSTIENFDLEEENGKKILLSCLFFLWHFRIYRFGGNIRDHTEFSR
jgi:hypothetical protein